MEIAIKKHSSSYFRDYNKDTFKMELESKTNTSNIFNLSFCNKKSEAIYSFDFSNRPFGITGITQSFRYDMLKSNINDTITKIKIVSKQNSGIIVIKQPFLHIKRSSKRVKTLYNIGVKGFQSDSTFFYYNEIEPTRTYGESEPGIDNALSALKKRYLKLMTTYKPGAKCTEETIYKDYKTLKGALQTILAKKNRRFINPEILGPVLLDFIKIFTTSKYQRNSTDLLLINRIIKEVNYYGFSDNSEFIYNSYKIREYLQSVLLVYEYLDLPQKKTIQNLLKWRLKTNKIFQENIIVTPIISDLMRLEYIYVLGYGLIVSEQKNIYLNKLFLYLSKILVSNHFNSWIKNDGTPFHHKSQNLSYTYSFNEMIIILDLIKDAPYHLEDLAFSRVIKSVISVFLMTNKRHYTNNLSGRHPFSNENPICLSTLIKLKSLKTNLRTKDIINQLLTDESIVEGFKGFNFGNTAIYRRNGFLAVAKGFSNNFWGSEIYADANRFGRYQGYGTLEIINRKGIRNSGFLREGWDWNRPPGSTSIILPFHKLEPDKQRVDEFTDKNFAGALDIDNIPDNPYLKRQGIFAFDFKERKNSVNHDSTFSFKKSYFFIKDYIICLGSNINKRTSKFKVNTNILQKGTSIKDSIFINGKPLKFNDSICLYKKDNNKIYIEELFESYFIYGFNALKARLGSQNSLLNDKSSTTTGIFKRISLNHGSNPNNEKYEYMIWLHDSNPKRLKKKEYLFKNKPYSVLQKNGYAHIIKMKNDDRVYYTIFEPYKSKINNDLLLSTTKAVLASLKLEGEILNISASDPSIIFDKTGISVCNQTEMVIRGKFSNQNLSRNVNLKYNGENTTLTLDLCDQKHIRLKRVN